MHAVPRYMEVAPPEDVVLAISDYPQQELCEVNNNFIESAWIWSHCSEKR